MKEFGRAAAVCAFLVLFLLLWLIYVAPSPQRQSQIGWGGQESPVPPVAAQEPQLPYDSRIPARVDTASSDRIVRRFHVVDSQTGARVPIRVRALTDGTAVQSSAAGSLSVSARAETWADAVVVQIEGTHYRPLEASLGIDSPETLKLEPSASSTVLLTCRGRVVPIERLEIAQVGREPIDEAGRWGRIGQDGIATVVHAIPVVVEAYGEGGGLYFSGIVEPGSEVHATSCLDGWRLRLAFSDDSPASHELVEVMMPGSAASRGELRLTDELGEILLPLDSMALDIALSSNRLKFAPLEVQPSGITLAGRMLCLPRLTGGDHGRLVIRVQPAVNRVRLMDGQTGQPVEGVALYAQRFVIPNGRVFVVPQYETVLEDGWMEFGTGRSSLLAVPRGVTGIVCAVGYRPLLLPQEAYPFVGLLDPPPVLEMQRVVDGALLRIYSHDQPVDTGSVVIRSSSSGEVLFTGGSSGDGSYGPFESEGQRIQVEIHSLGILRDVDTARLEGGVLLYEVQVDLDLGRLRVEGPSHAILPALHVRSEVGLDLPPSRHEGSTCFFGDLPPGRYLVGPRQWLSHVAARPEALERLGVTVLPGAEVTTGTHPDWVLEEDIRGRILFSSEVARPVLALSYMTHVSLELVSQGPRIDLDPDGSYIVPSGEPRPEAIVAFDFVNGTARLRGAFRPGGTVHLCERPLTLRASAGSGRVRLEYPVPLAAVEVLLDAEKARSIWLDLRGGDITIPIPCDVNMIHLQIGKQGRITSIVCPPQGTVYVDVPGIPTPGHR